MRAAVHAFQEHYIHVLTERGDAVIDLDAVFLAQRLGIPLDVADAGGDIGAAAFVSRHDFAARDVPLGIRVIERLGKRSDVGGVAADDADAQVGADRHRTANQSRCESR